MTIQAQRIQEGETVNWTADAAYNNGDVVQLRDGRAGVVSQKVASGDVVGVDVGGIYKVLKTASIVLLKGGKTFWDQSASKAHFKQVDDRDFYLGALQDDAASADTTCLVALNVQPVYKIELTRDSGKSVIVGTSAAGGFGYPVRMGGAVQQRITATSEAQKVDLLSDDGFATGALAIVEGAIQIVDGDAAGAADFNVGIASGTHATDADSIAQHVLMHIDGNSTSILFQSKDGTTTVAAASSTVAYSTNTRFEFWLDCRDTANVKIYVDGVRVISGSTFKIVGSSSTWKLLTHLEKTSSTDTFDGRVDWLRVRTAQV